MSCQLRSDLTKRDIYKVVKEFAPEGIQLPKISECHLTKYHCTYWLDFSSNGIDYKACFNFLKFPYISYHPADSGHGQVYSSEYRPDNSVYVDIDFDYALNNGLVQEAV